MNLDKLIIYQKAKIAHDKIADQLLILDILNKYEKDQLSRASLSIVLNIAEGAGRYGLKDRRKFYIIARGSALECYSIFDVIEKKVKSELIADLKFKIDEISKILFTMIRNLESK